MFFDYKSCFREKNSKILRLSEIFRTLSMYDKSTFMDSYGKIEYQQI